MKKTPKSILDDLVDTALSYGLFRACSRGGSHLHCQNSNREPCKPGYLIKKLSEEDREILRDLRSDDAAKGVLRTEFWM